MLLIVQPAFTEVNYYYITPIVFCIFFACVAISVRSLSKTEANYTIAFYFTLLCTALGLSTVFFGIEVVTTVRKGDRAGSRGQPRLTAGKKVKKEGMETAWPEEEGCTAEG